MAFRPWHTSNKVLVVTYAVLLVLCISAITALHIHDRNTMRDDALDKLTSIGNTLAGQVTGFQVQQMLKKYTSRGMIFKNTQDPFYYVQHEALRRATEANDLKIPIRVVAYDSLHKQMQVIVTAGNTPTYLYVYGKDGNILAHNLKAGGQLDLIGNTLPRLISMTPLTDRKGNTIAALVIERASAEVIAEATSNLVRNIIIAMVLLVIAGLVLFGSVGRWLRRAEQAHKALERLHEDATDSIAYAGKISNALIPSPDVFSEKFESHFVINRPKDVVSGDFYWYHEFGTDQCWVAVADCTGHGLPGAMMTAIGCSTLNDVVSEDPWQDPAKILERLNDRMMSNLHQKGRKRGAGDGMDIALCRMDRKEREILFAGAYRPLYWLHEGQLTVINGDRRPIGGSHHEAERKFSCHRIAYSPGDRLYLFSDGYVDQFGGPDGKKFMTKRLNKLLTKHQYLPLVAQANKLETTFDTWKGEQEQLDDVCMVGLEV